MTLLDIKEFSEKVKQTKESQLKTLQLAKKQLIDEADTVPATEFDKLINPKLKSVIITVLNFRKMTYLVCIIGTTTMMMH